MSRKLCRECTEAVGPRSPFYCNYHLGWHAGYHNGWQRHKRDLSPELREREREAVKLRMRRLRAERRGAAR